MADFRNNESIQQIEGLGYVGHQLPRLEWIQDLVGPRFCLYFLSRLSRLPRPLGY